MTTFGITKALRATYDEALVRAPEGDDRRARVLAIDPTKTVAATGNPKLVELTEAVKDRLTRALERLE